MIVDTSALIAISRREPECDDFVKRLLATSNVRISAGTLIESRMVAERDGGIAELDELLSAVDAEIVSVDAGRRSWLLPAFAGTGAAGTRRR